MPFLDLATLKLRLRIPAADVSQDSLLTGLVAAVNNEMLGLFNLDQSTTTTYSVTYDVLDSVPGIWLKQYPVRIVNSVSIDGAALAAGEFYLDPRTDVLGSLMRKSGSGAAQRRVFWPAGAQVVTVSHDAGWDGDVVDAALTSAAVSIATWLYNTEPKTGLESERIGQYAYKMASGAAGIGYGGAAAGGYPAGAGRVLAQWIRPFADWS